MPYQTKVAILLELLALVYAGYAGYRNRRLRYGLLTVVLIGLLAGVASLWWAPDPPGAPVMIPVAAFVIWTIAKWFSPKRADAARRSGRIALGVLLVAIALFTSAYA